MYLNRYGRAMRRDPTTILLLYQMDSDAVVEQPRTVEVEIGRAVDEDEAKDSHVEIDGSLDRLAQPGRMVQCHGGSGMFHYLLLVAL